jgi:hypothetical protein
MSKPCTLEGVIDPLKHMRSKKYMDDFINRNAVKCDAPELELSSSVIAAGLEVLSSNFLDLVDGVPGTKEKIVRSILREYEAARVRQSN